MVVRPGDHLSPFASTSLWNTICPVSGHLIHTSSGALALLKSVLILGRTTFGDPVHRSSPVGRRPAADKRWPGTGYKPGITSGATPPWPLSPANADCQLLHQTITTNSTVFEVASALGVEASLWTALTSAVPTTTPSAPRAIAAACAAVLDAEADADGEAVCRLIRVTAAATRRRRARGAGDAGDRDVVDEARRVREHAGRRRSSVVGVARRMKLRPAAWAPGGRVRRPPRAAGRR